MRSATSGPADRLCETVLRFADRGLCPATGGNFSTRIDANRVLITASGVDKRRLTPRDLLSIGLDGTLIGDGKPSAETGLHLALYNADPTIGAVLHGHSLANTVLSRVGNPQRLTFSGYEMQKAIRGQSNHADQLSLPVFHNSQDMDELAGWLRERFDEATLACAFLVRGHGIYVWGTDLVEASRHLEGWEFLLDCELQRRTLENGL
ncbi:MAG: methylthioribulose 1-phosphate dehydratase [Salinisphaera sp.]|jgi:methylthioribulose-1-phosphate dehydratase|nr:methylthioribulose 1-phosphate dehydratase [Salinisphaera sp.]